MTLSPTSEIRNVSDITTDEEQRISDFLHGMIYSWCIARGSDWFSVRDLLGKQNTNWSGTPMQVLYQKHSKKGKTQMQANKDAGKDAGWLLKKVISNDSRTFDTREHSFIRQYRWNQP